MAHTRMSQSFSLKYVEQVRFNLKMQLFEQNLKFNELHCCLRLPVQTLSRVAIQRHFGWWSVVHVLVSRFVSDYRQIQTGQTGVWSCRPDRPSLCSGYHRQETKFIVRPCGETRWPHASSPRIITGRSSQNRLPFWSWLAATARTPAPFMDLADRRRYTLQHWCWMVQGSSSWPLWVDATDLCCLRDLIMMMMKLASKIKALLAAA